MVRSCSRILSISINLFQVLTWRLNGTLEKGLSWMCHAWGDSSTTPTKLVGSTTWRSECTTDSSPETTTHPSSLRTESWTWVSLELTQPQDNPTRSLSTWPQELTMPARGTGEMVSYKKISPKYPSLIGVRFLFVSKKMHNNAVMLQSTIASAITTLLGFLWRLASNPLRFFVKHSFLKLT